MNLITDGWIILCALPQRSNNFEEERFALLLFAKEKGFAFRFATYGRVCNIQSAWTMENVIVSHFNRIHCQVVTNSSQEASKELR